MAFVIFLQVVDCHSGQGRAAPFNWPRWIPDGAGEIGSVCCSARRRLSALRSEQRPGVSVECGAFSPPTSMALQNRTEFCGQSTGGTSLLLSPAICAARLLSCVARQSGWPASLELIGYSRNLQQAAAFKARAAFEAIKVEQSSTFAEPISAVGLK